MFHASTMPDKMLHGRYLVSQICTIFGLSITVMDVVRGLPLVFGVFGGFFAMMAGFYSWRLKREQFKRLEMNQPRRKN